MLKCVPIREMKDTGKFTELVRSNDGPITVTRNGTDALVVMSPDYWDGLQLQLAKANLLARIEVGEKEIAEGSYLEADAAVNQLRDKYGL